MRSPEQFIAEIEPHLTKPDWYRPFVANYKSYLEEYKDATHEQKAAAKDTVEAFFERALGAGAIMLGATGPDWDEERSPIDRAVIHHTSREPGITPERLSVLGLLQIYAPHYAGAQDVGGQAMYSNHFDAQGRQMFYAYHYLVRTDGQVEPLVPESQIGWQAGNWDINCRSIGICIDDDLEDAQPTAAALAGAAGILHNHKGTIAPGHVIGHRDVRNTTCPGNTFDPGWKQKLLDLAAL